MRTSSVVRDVRYGKGQIAYSTFDAPSPCEDVLRLAFVPKSVTADGPLPLRQDTAENGYTVKPLSNGDCLVTIRHDGCRDVMVEGDDPQQSWPISPSIRARGPRRNVARGGHALAPGAGPRGVHRQSSPPHRPGRPQRRQGRRVSRRRETTLRNRLLVPANPRASSPLLQEWPGRGQAHAGDRGHGHEESGLVRHPGLRRGRPVLCRRGGQRFRRRRRPERDAAA